MKQISNLYKDMTIRSKFMIALISIALIPIASINVFYYRQMDKFIEEKFKNYELQIVKQVNQQLEEIYSQVIITQRQLIEGVVNTAILEEYDEAEPIERIKMVKKIDDIMKNLKRSFSKIHNIHLISKRQNLVYSSSPIKQSIYFKDGYYENLKNVGCYEEMIIQTNTYSTDYNGDTIISFIRGINGLKKDEIVGWIQIDVEYKQISEIIESLELEEGSYITIEGAGQKIIYDSRKDIALANEGISITNPIEAGTWNINYIGSKESINKEFRYLVWISMGINTISICAAILLAFILSREILKPLEILINKMKRVGEGKLDVQFELANNRDFRIIAETFNKMVNRIEQLMTNVMEKEKEKRRVEFKVLQTQINSHFLYNTLNTIKWMAIIEKTDNIAQAIVALVNVLEYTCKNQDKVVMIKDEIKFTKDYVAIQKMRFNDRVKVIYDIDKEIENSFILKLTLQPIVENAFIHAFREEMIDGEINIKGWIEDQKVIFRIQDNGKGMFLDKKSKLTGIGIGSVEERLKMYFDKEAHVDIKSKIDEGTCIDIFFPLIKEEDFNV